MKFLKISVLFLFAAALVIPFAFTRSVDGQAATDAPTTDMNVATDDLFNGFGLKGTVADDPPTPEKDFVNNKALFDEVDEIDEGVGPCYNAQSCRECHQSPDSGAASQISEFRAGHLNGVGNFVDAPGGSLINDRAVASAIQERVSSADDIRTFRMSISLLGDGFVEAIGNATLTANVAAQPAGQRGTLINVPVLEAGAAPGATRVGRFGWKDQNASLRTFAGDAYVNEMGITNEIFGTENTSNGNPVGAFDSSETQPNNVVDVAAFTGFMRALSAPGRGPQNAQTNAGSALFDSLGCAVCHTRSFTTSPVGTTINGGAFVVPASLANKIIHPFGDYALHDVGTGDGIVQNGGQGTRNQVRTAALWGLRARIRLMHDGESLTVNDSILRHGGQATTARNNYNGLAIANKQAVLAFCLSL